VRFLMIAIVSYSDGTAYGSAMAPLSPSSATAAGWAIFASIQRPPCTRPFATLGNLEPLKWF
jgi:hypothetical protein